MIDINTIFKKYDSELRELYNSGFNMFNKNAKAAVRTCEAYLMYCLCLEFEYKNILEIGTGTGFSSLVLAKALLKNKGQIDTVDINPESSSVFNYNFSELLNKFPEIKDVIKFHNENSATLLPNLDKKYDLAFIDGCHDYECVLEDYKLVKDKINSGGCIVFHDVVKTTDYKQGIWDVVEEIKATGIDFYYLKKENFNYFNFEEDIRDVDRMKNKWLTKEYLKWTLESKHNPKELLAFMFV